MKYPFLFFIAAVLFSNGFVYGQNDLTPLFPSSAEGLNSPGAQLNVLNQQANNGLLQNFNAENNNILITQVGVNNVSTVQTTATNSSIILGQTGNDNIMQLDLNATNIDYRALQTGNDNMLLEFSNGGATQLLQRSIEQTGNGQNLIIHGTNSLVDRMTIKMATGGQSVIIRNTN